MAVGVGETLVVPVPVHKVEGFATIGSTVQVSIINIMLFEQLPGNLQQAEIVRLKGICTKNNTIPAIRIVGVKITLGRNEFPWDVFLAGTADTIFLGLDLLRGKQCVVVLANNTIHHNLPVKVNDAEKGATFMVEPLNVNLRGLLGAVTCSREELTKNTAKSNPDVSRLSLSEEAGEDKTLAAESRWSTSGELESGSAASKLHPDQRMTSRG